MTLSHPETLREPAGLAAFEVLGWPQGQGSEVVHPSSFPFNKTDYHSVTGLDSTFSVQGTQPQSSSPMGKQLKRDEDTYSCVQTCGGQRSTSASAPSHSFILIDTGPLSGTWGLPSRLGSLTSEPPGIRLSASQC